MIRIGKVSSVNYLKGTVKVAFEDKNNIVSTDLPYLSFEYNMPQIKDTVLCIFLNNGTHNGFCLGKYYNANNMPNIAGSNVYFKDILGEASYEYDKQSKTLTISAENIVLNGSTIIKGNLQVDGDLNATGSINAANFPGGV